MNINIYYGGRGLIDDPTLYVLNKMEEVLDELHVKVKRYNLHEYKNTITTLPPTLKDADGIILATTVEWYGIGGYMQQFLDACWLYGDKEKISKIYMCPIVMSTTYGERDAKLTLSTAWEILGGLPCSGICGYIADTVTLEMSKEYAIIIEKKAESMYRTINQKLASFPASNQAVKNMVSFTQNIDLTPQESEQLSQYVADDGYVQRQKEDIQELASLFRNLMNEQDGVEEGLIKALKAKYKSQLGVKGTYIIRFEDRPEPLFIMIDGPRMECEYKECEKVDIEITVTSKLIEEILEGKISFQRAFMSGVMKMKGDFNLLRILDQVFLIEEAY